MILPKAVWQLGDLSAVVYKAIDDKKMYMHKFNEKRRPALTSSSDGKKLVIIGGNYHVTRRGIEG